MLKDKLWVRGDVLILRNNEVVRDIRNTVVNVGKEFVAARIGGNLVSVMTHMAVGLGSTPVQNPPIDTQLEAEVPLSNQGRIALVVSGGSVSATTVEYSATWQANEATGIITEAGIFNDSIENSGSMLARTVFGGIDKAPDDLITINWTLSVN